MSVVGDIRSIPRRIAARRARRAAGLVATDEDHQRVMREVVDEVAAYALARGAATLTVEHEASLGWTGPTLTLEPRHPASAKIELGATVEATFVIVGRRQLQLELWDPVPEARRAELVACLEALVDGRVEAAVESHWLGPRSTLTFHTEPEPTISRGYRVGTDEPHWREQYEPY